MLNYLMRTLKATIDEEGRVELLEPFRPSDKRQALVTILESELLDPETAPLRPSGLCEGEFRVPDDFDPLPEDILEDFERA